MAYLSKGPSLSLIGGQLALFWSLPYIIAASFIHAWLIGRLCRLILRREAKFLLSSAGVLYTAAVLPQHAIHVGVSLAQNQGS